MILRHKTNYESHTMEFNEYRTNEVLEPVAVQFYADRTRSTSPTTPVLSTNACCELEDILSDKEAKKALTESLQGSIRLNRSQLVDQELTIRPEANIDANVPDNLDLYKVIYEVESDNEQDMSELDGVAVQDSNVKEPPGHTEAGEP
ncbi:hypothetical protein MSG28_000176 [Choristoneura fumiferana]|uniref:Uncharacterized protein n=1 Tax=Choristoneura fumiferana TaxID=7141 RepID=A0ACC0K021_CHOFU|nr:hypothetical protein MSG28_000176 [Choristoneura fumiferana]